MAEFPHLGSHCGVEFCKQLDFLPIKCDSCQEEFCTTHFSYDEHNCPQAYRKNIQVPVCPICSKPVPTPRGVPIDYQVNEHIQNNCEVLKTQKIYNNRCTVDNCKKKELIPVTCPTCSRNYCLRHRHEKDHNCEEIVKTNKVVNRGYFTNVFASLSLKNNTPNNCSSQARTTQISNDEQVARALQNEYDEVNASSSQRSQQQRSGGQNNCSVS